MNETQLRQKLPIGDNEKILAVFRHHWFAYAIIYIFIGIVITVVMAASIMLASFTKDTVGGSSGSQVIILVGLVVSLIAVAFAFIPLYLLQHEALVLTEEAVLQLKKPSIFANQTSQVNLAHINDVTVSQDALGTMFGYGHLKIETPGEQDDYEFDKIPAPQKTAKQIIEAHENYAAALESGQIKTTLGSRQPMQGTSWRPENDMNQAAPQQYQQPPVEQQPPQTSEVPPANQSPQQ